MKTFLALFFAALMFFVPLPANAANITGSLGSPPSNCGTYTPVNNPSHTFMIGDSITARGKDEMLAVRPNWEINGLRSRNVDCSVGLVAERLKAGYLSRLVVALGTNAVEGWGLDDYQGLANMIPAGTQLIFVNTYRDPVLWPTTNPFRTRASVQYYYSQYMATVASKRPNTCVANWRSFAANHPDMLTDGTHPTAPGSVNWANIIDNATLNCS